MHCDRCVLQACALWKKKNSDHPLITFAITTYKRPELLKETVKSVISQDYKNFKVIIGNDNPLEKVSFKTLDIKEEQRNCTAGIEHNEQQLEKQWKLPNWWKIPKLVKFQKLLGKGLENVGKISFFLFWNFYVLIIY